MPFQGAFRPWTFWPSGYWCCSMFSAKDLEGTTPVVVLREHSRHGDRSRHELDHSGRQARRQHAVRLPRGTAGEMAVKFARSSAQQHETFVCTACSTHETSTQRVVTAKLFAIGDGRSCSQRVPTSGFRSPQALVRVQQEKKRREI